MSTRKEFEKLQNWADKYEKAQSDGVFEGAPSPPVPTPQTAEDNFWGMVNSNPTDAVSRPDAQYWKNLWDATRPDGPSSIVIEEETEEVVEEEAYEKAIDKEIPTPGDENNAKSFNPTHRDSQGEDQALETEPLGVSFSAKDVNDLAEMKVKLHALQDKMNTNEGLGKSGKSLESRIASAIKEIEDLSNSISSGFEDNKAYGIKGSGKK